MRSNPARASGGTPAPKVRLGLPAAQEIWQERSPAPRNPQIGALPAKLLLWRSSSIPSWNEVQPRCDRGWLQIGWSRHEWKWLYLQDNDVTSWRHLPCCYPGQCCNGCFIAAYHACGLLLLQALLLRDTKNCPRRSRSEYTRRTARGGVALSLDVATFLATFASNKLTKMSCRVATFA